jgi:hypothetical protein
LEELKKVKGLAVLDNSNDEIIFTGYGHTLSSCHMTFPSFEYLKSGLQGNDEALKRRECHMARRKSMPISCKNNFIITIV